MVLNKSTVLEVFNTIFLKFPLGVRRILIPNFISWDVIFLKLVPVNVEIRNVISLQEQETEKQHYFVSYASKMRNWYTLTGKFKIIQYFASVLLFNHIDF